MGGKHCRLYDENLVHNIMVSVGLSVLEYVKDHRGAGPDEVCEFVELNAAGIVEETIEQLNSMDSDAGEADSDDPGRNWKPPTAPGEKP